MSPHPAPEALESYVLGALEPPAERELEAHVNGCESCARALTREARLELRLAESADALAARPRMLRRLAPAFALAAGLAAAVTWSPPPASPLPLVPPPPEALAINQPMDVPNAAWADPMNPEPNPVEGVSP